MDGNKKRKVGKEGRKPGMKLCCPLVREMLAMPLRRHGDAVLCSQPPAVHHTCYDVLVFVLATQQMVTGRLGATRGGRFITLSGHWFSLKIKASMWTFVFSCLTISPFLRTMPHIYKIFHCCNVL